MRIFYLILLLLLLFQPAKGQEVHTQMPPCDPGTYTEFKPVFPGGDRAMFKLIIDNLTYPPKALQDRIGGKVVLGFTIDTTGKVGAIEVLESVREDIDQEAVRLLSLLPDFSPGIQNCKKVAVKYRLPINFYPDNRWKRKYNRGKITSGTALNASQN